MKCRRNLLKILLKLTKIRRKIWLMSEGDLAFGRKLFVSGKANANEKNSSLLAFKRELRELETAVKNLTKETEKAEKETAKARAKLAEREEQILDLQSLIIQVERDIAVFGNSGKIGRDKKSNAPSVIKKSSRKKPPKSKKKSLKSKRV